MKTSLATLGAAFVAGLAISVSARGQGVSTKLVSMSHPGGCILPTSDLITVEVTSQRIQVPHDGGIASWFSDPTIGATAEFDLTLSSPTDAGDQRTFPTAKSTSITSGQVKDIVRLLNQFAPIKRAHLTQKDAGGNDVPFASVDAQVFLVRKTGDSIVTKMANAVEAVGGSLPSEPWAAGTQLFGNLAKQILSSFASNNDASSRLPDANISLQFASSSDKCDGFLHDGVSEIVMDAPSGKQPLPGEQFVTIGDLDNKCLYATSGPDPDIKFTSKTAGSCPDAIPDGATTLGNPGIIFKVAGFPRVQPTTAMPLVPHADLSRLMITESYHKTVKSYIATHKLALKDDDIAFAVKVAAAAKPSLPSKTDALSWSLQAISKCKKIGIPIDDCL